MSEVAPSSGPQGKKPLNEMSNEELVQKCKSLLQIAQKAKNSKDDAIKELNEGKRKLEQLSALEEVTKTLTEQKLEQAEQINNFKRQLALQTEKLDNLTTKCDDLLIQNEGKDRQVCRINDENEDLLRKIDALSQEVEQTKLKSSEELENLRSKLELDSNNLNEDLAQNCSQLQEENLQCQKKLASVITELDAKTLEIEKLKETEAEFASERESLDKELKRQKSINERLEKELFTSNEDLINSEEQEQCRVLQIEKAELLQALNSQSNKCVDAESELRIKMEENEQLSKQLEESEVRIVPMENELLSYKNNLEELSERNKKLQEDFNAKEAAMTQKMEDLQAELLQNSNGEGKIRSLESELEEERKKGQELKSSNEDVVQKLVSLQAQLDSSEEQNQELSNQILQQDKALQDEVESSSHKIQNLEGWLEEEKQRNKENKVETEQITILEVELGKVKEEREKLMQSLQNQQNQTSQLQANHDETLKDLEEKAKTITDLQTEVEAVNCKNFNLLESLEDQQNVTSKAEANKDETIKTLEDKVTELETELEKINGEKQRLGEDLQRSTSELKSSHEEAIANLDGKVKKIDDLEAELRRITDEKSNLSKTLKDHEDQLSEKQLNHEEAIKNLRDQHEQEMQIVGENVNILENNLQLSLKEMESLKAKIKDLEDNLSHSESDEKVEQISRKYQEGVRQWKEVNGKTIAGLKSDHQELKRDVSNALNSYKQWSSDLISEKEMEFALIKQGILRQLSDAEERNTDLIDEMNQMNKELKNRSSSISSLESKVSEFKAKLEEASNTLERTEAAKLEMNKIIAELKASEETNLGEGKNLQNQIFSLKQELEKMASELQKVEQENQKLRRHSEERLAKPISEEVPSEVMSTSTISKAEDMGRMADIESSFEERYGKLKLVAIKLKKKTIDQENLIKQLQPSKDKYANLMQNFNSLQLQNDEQGDTIDEQKKTISSLKKELESSQTSTTSLRENLEKTEEHVANLESENSSITTELSTLKKESLENADLIKTLKSHVENLEKEKGSLTSSYKNLSDELGNLQGADKKQDLLDMELETAEKRIEELSTICQDLESKITEVSNQKLHEISLRENCEQVIKDLEHSLEKEMERAEDFKGKLGDARSSISKLELEQSELKGQMQSLLQRVEGLNSDNERLAFQLADVSGNAASNSQTLTKRNESLQKMVNLLEADMKRKDQKLQETEEKLLHLEKDYEGYKVRAQSVLKQAKETNNQLGSKSQEVIALEHSVQTLNEKLMDQKTQLSANSLELRHVQEDHDRLMERHSALLQEMATKELAARNKHDQLLQLANQAEKARQDGVAAAHESMEGVKQSYRLQIQDLQSSHSNEVSKLQKQIDDLENKIIKLQMTKISSPTQDLNVKMIEREAAEGSENFSDTNSRNNSVSPGGMNSDKRNSPGSAIIPGVHGLDKIKENRKFPSSQTPLPLDQLLFSPSPDHDEDSTLDTTNAFSDIEARLISAEKKISHLSSLLSESESENARLQQLAEVLKEEIRTYQRSEERKKHIDNLEYVKNIILKFVTLPGNDEKLRLIPVLTTILKLSTQEVEQIQKSIHAEIETNSSQEVRWSTYLGLWSN